MEVVAEIAFLGIISSIIVLIGIAIENTESIGAIVFGVFVLFCLVFAAAVSLMPDKEYPPVFEIEPIAQCRQSPEWCEIQEPELYAAMHGDPA